MSERSNSIQIESSLIELVSSLFVLIPDIVNVPNTVLGRNPWLWFQLCLSSYRANWIFFIQLVNSKNGIVRSLVIHIYMYLIDLVSSPIELESTLIESESFTEKKKEIWPSPMTKPPIPTENSKTKGQHTHTPPKSSITQQLRDRLRTVSWSNK